MFGEFVVSIEHRRQQSLPSLASWVFQSCVTGIFFKSKLVFKIFVVFLCCWTLALNISNETSARVKYLYFYVGLMIITLQADENTSEVPAGDMETESVVADITDPNVKEDMADANVKEDIADPNVKENNSDLYECLPRLDVICE